MKITQKHNVIAVMTVMMSAFLTTYSCSSDDDEAEQVYPKVSDSKYYMDPEWDESIIYLRPKDFREKKFFPGVRVVEQLVDYPAYVTYRTISGDGMDICFVPNVDNKLEPTTRTEFYDGEGAMATVLEWEYIDLIRRYRMTVSADEFFKYNIKNPCKVYVTALVTNAATYNFQNLDTYFSTFNFPGSEESKLESTPTGTVIPKSEWTTHPTERWAYLTDLKLRK